jgi:hypothetical protein
MKAPEMSKAEIIMLCREWFDQQGEPPRRVDWDPSMARRMERMEIVKKFEDDGCWPYAYRVVDVFGTFTAMVIEAGFYPRVRTRKWRETAVEDRSEYLRRAIALLKASGGGEL